MSRKAHIVSSILVKYFDEIRDKDIVEILDTIMDNIDLSLSESEIKSQVYNVLYRFVGKNLNTI